MKGPNFSGTKLLGDQISWDPNFSETKFLGVIIDSKLTWKSHINYIKSKVAKGIGILSKPESH